MPRTPELDKEFDLEIAEPDPFSFGKYGQTFNHELLVMESYRRCQDALAKEMVEGFWSDKIDKFGNIMTIYNPDTRKAAIEAIKTLKNCMVFNIKDSDYEKRIVELEKNSEQKYLDILGEQNEWWLKSPPQFRNDFFKKNMAFSTKSLNDKLPFWHKYLDEKLEIFRKIFEQLELCIAEKTKYFRRVAVTNI